MRVAIVNITKGQMSGGYRAYLCNIIPRMISNPAVKALLCVSPGSLNTRQWFDESLGVDFADYNPAKFFLSGVGIELKKHLEKFSPDIIFIPSGRYLKYKNMPVVNMVQNMEPLAYYDDKNPLSEKVNNLLRRKMVYYSLDKSQRIIAISEFVKQFLVVNSNVIEDKIVVIYHGCGNNGNKYVRPSAVPQNLSGRFIFTAGSIRPARGLEDVIEAIKLLALEKVDINLVIASLTSSNMLPYRRHLEEYISRNSIDKKIIWAEGLSKAEMAWCYVNCRVFIMTSRVEACPIIALEAMSHRCICISADNPPLPEIFDSSSIYYTAGDGENLAETMKTVFAWNDDRRKSISEKAGRRAAEFSWDVCAKRTIATLIKAVNK